MRGRPAGRPYIGIVERWSAALGCAAADNGRGAAMDLITLKTGVTALALSPAAGGSIARFWSESSGRTIEWLRPASATAAQRRMPLDMSSFPLVPYSGRICDGRFSFQGRDIALPLNFLPEPHSIHGQGWLVPWKVVR